MCIKHGRRRIHRAKWAATFTRRCSRHGRNKEKKNIRTVFSRVFVPLKSVRNRNLVDENIQIKVLTNVQNYYKTIFKYTS